MNNLKYTKNGDYLIPDLTLGEEANAEPIGKYGMLRDSFLQENRSGLHSRLSLTGKLSAHLREVDRDTQEKVDKAVSRMAEKQGVNEELKARNQMQWVGMMNNLIQAAEEMILPETVYSMGKVE